MNGLPKPLVDVGGKPLLERQIELLARYGFTRVLLLVNYASSQIIEYCASRKNWGLAIECIDDGGEPLGTAGAVLAVNDLLDEDVLVIYGDTMLEVDLERFWSFHCAREDVAASLFLHPNDHPHDSDLVEIDEKGRIVAFHSYPHAANRYYPNLVNAALYCVRRSSLVPWRESHVALDFGKDIFPALLGSGAILQGYNSLEYIKDCGTPARLDKVCADLASGRIFRSNLNVKQSAVFLDRDGTINREVHHLSHHEQFALLPGVPNAIKQLNDSIYRTIVITNQPVVARGDCSVQDLVQIHNKMETLLGREGAYVDRIYFCPHHPDRGYAGEIVELKIKCNCRKPEPGMIERAVKDLNIDVSSSWMIGDTSVDVLTAKRAGLRSIMVETGFAGLDRTHWILPDFVVPDLSAAVRFILIDHPRLIKMCEPLASDVREGDFVFVGGLSRSGKSNFASCLKDALGGQGKHAIVLALDRYLLNEDKRSKGVIGRYALSELENLLSALSAREGSVDLVVPAYDKTRRTNVPGTEVLAVGREDVVIVEGTIALSLLKFAKGRRVHACFINLEEKIRHERVVAEYGLRGFDIAEADAIYFARQKDEAPFILAGADLAKWHFDLGLIGQGKS